MAENRFFSLLLLGKSTCFFLRFWLCVFLWTEERKKAGECTYIACRKTSFFGGEPADQTKQNLFVPLGYVSIDGCHKRADFVRSWLNPVENGLRCVAFTLAGFFCSTDHTVLSVSGCPGGSVGNLVPNTRGTRAAAWVEPSYPKKHSQLAHAVENAQFLSTTHTRKGTGHATPFSQ